jgi:hypothetical protein
VSAPAPGPLGEEALRLVEAAREWAVRTFPEVDTQVATGSPECCWCPLCRTVAVLRGDRPEVTERLAAVLTTAAGALAAVLEAAGRPAGDGGRAGPAGPAGPAAGHDPVAPPPPMDRAGGVQVIPLDDECADR